MRHCLAVLLALCLCVPSAIAQESKLLLDTWDAAYEAPLACHDPGEPDRKGGLLYLRHGKGVFIYTGYSWFRELPAGVPGAYRIFANLLAGGKPLP